MSAPFLVAWKYIRYYRLRSAILVACISLIAVLPLSLQVLLDESEAQLLSRASTTPLVLGAKGSALDLVMNTLYFDDEVPGAIPAGAAEGVTQTGLALGIPVYARFRARGYPVVGTTLDYFGYRKLDIASGRPLALLGEAVIGASVADELRLGPGDSLVSTPETVFDLAGIYPLKMQVVGVLERSHSPDDQAVLVDIRTAWIIAGLGHGHADLARLSDPSVIMETSGNTVVASPKLLQYTEITDANRESFHFHGNTAAYPLTAALVVPQDTRAGTILRGRYLDADAEYQMLKPDDVIDGLLQNIFRIKHVIDGVIVIVGLATGLAVLLVFLLSMRLRQREIETITRIGCSRLAVLQLLAAEVLIFMLLSAVIVTAAVAIVDVYASDLVRLLIIN